MKATQAPREICPRVSEFVKDMYNVHYWRSFQALQKKRMYTAKKYFEVTGFKSDNTIWVKFFIA